MSEAKFPYNLFLRFFAARYVTLKVHKACLPHLGKIGKVLIAQGAGRPDGIFIPKFRIDPRGSPPS
jgi:hypothetical protein